MLFACISYASAAILVQLSLLALFLRISPHPGRTFRYWTYTVMGLSIGVELSAILTLLAQCMPLRKLWDRTNQRGHCISSQGALHFYYAFTSLHVFTVICIYILPMPTFYHLQMPRRQKIGLWALMSIGAGLIHPHAPRVLTEADSLISISFFRIATIKISPDYTCKQRLVKAVVRETHTW